MGNPKPEVLASARPKMMSTLVRVIAALEAWQEANGGEAEEAKADKQREAYVKSGKQAGEDVRSKAARRQMVAMLMPRVQSEMNALSSDSWTKTLGLNDAKLTGKGREDEGGMNKVSELHYATESGEFSGFFKADKGFDAKMAGHDIDVGIRQADPNYGARSVAMYRLDQLLGAGVTAKVEFAVHDGQLGTVMESAKGTRGADASFSYGKTSEEKGKVALDDGTLQRCLNKLQILDAISGQLDRHAGNYFIQQDDKGDVTGVTGIDLDMAFGKDMLTYNDKNARAAHNYRELPDYLDEEFATRILAVPEDDIVKTLTGLLSEAEVAATVSRFRSVKEKINDVRAKGQLKKSWDSTTAKENRVAYGKVGFGSGRKSYQDDLSSKTDSEFVEKFRESLKNSMKSDFGDIPEMTRSIYESQVASVATAKAVAKLVYEGQIDEGRLDDIAADLSAELAMDDDWRNHLEVAVQELGKAAGSQQLGSEAAIHRALAKVLPRYVKAPVG
jgi:hypothetical protein